VLRRQLALLLREREGLGVWQPGAWLLRLGLWRRPERVQRGGIKGGVPSALLLLLLLLLLL
jgi:hypothetical protein